MIWSALTCPLFGPGVPARSCHQLPGPHLLLEKLFSASSVKLVLGGEIAAGSDWTRYILIMRYPTAGYSLKSLFPFKTPAERRCFK